MHMILEHSHDFVVIEERYPMKESIQKSLRIPIESLAYTVDGHMVVNKFDRILV